jgi:hypothetical protein
VSFWLRLRILDKITNGYGERAKKEPVAGGVCYSGGMLECQVAPQRGQW